MNVQQLSNEPRLNLDLEQLRRLSLFDSNCRLGRSELTTSDAPATVSELIAEMDRCGIAEALVHHSIASENHPVVGNKRLLNEIQSNQRLHGCWVVLPPASFEMSEPPQLVESMLAAGIKAARMLPSRHRFLLSSWSIDPLLEELARHNLPLFIDYERPHWSANVVDYNEIYRICSQFPSLPLVLVREGIGSVRYLYPLLSELENLYLEVSYYQAASGLADISARFGARRLLFGTGLPFYAAGPPISMLVHAELSPEEQRLIAGGNLRRLLAEVI